MKKAFFRRPQAALYNNRFIGRAVHANNKFSAFENTLRLTIYWYEQSKTVIVRSSCKTDFFPSFSF
jgi:hypothetical protein